MSAYASLAGFQALKADVVIPYTGIWSADVTLASAAKVPASVKLVLADLTLAGTVYRTDAFAGVQVARVVGGAGGWRKSLDAAKYVNPIGVKASMILEDAAKAVGETVKLGGLTLLGLRVFVIVTDAALLDCVHTPLHRAHVVAKAIKTSEQLIELFTMVGIPARLVLTLLALGFLCGLLFFLSHCVTLSC